MKISKKRLSAEIASRSFPCFAETLHPRLDPTPFHRRYYDILDRFASGRIRRLIVSIPPQHGKSTAASQLLPAYILGKNPSANIAVASYNMALASRFSRQVQRIMSEQLYKAAFPCTRLREAAARGSNYVRTAEEFDIVGTGGRLLAAGRESSLTGNTVDVFILDDLYKDAMEANSPVVRDNTWAWYNSVVKTRLHNGSQELIAFTRWHDDDLIGRIEAHEQVVELTDMEELASVPPDAWVKINFEAVKASAPSPLDPRAAGEPLWPERHSLELLRQKRQLDPFVFETMYQGHPASREGVLYKEFAVYRDLPEDTVRRGNYTDTADTGGDFLCSVCYETGRDGVIYITDVVYSRESMETTEAEVAEMLRRNHVQVARIESNNGGRGFARAVGKLVPETQVEWFHQSRNKEARILSNSAAVNRSVAMPENWQIKWKEFHNDLATYRRLYRANRRHDAPDVLSGIIETETEQYEKKKIKAFGFKS